MTGFGAEQKGCHLADGLPLIARDRSLAVRRSDGKVCPEAAVCMAAENCLSWVETCRFTRLGLNGEVVP